MSVTPGVPRPVSAYPAAVDRTLDAWLDPAAGAALEPTVPTALRQIARSRAADIAAASTAVSFGMIAILLGGYWGVFGHTVVPVIAFGLSGIALILVGIALIRRFRNRLPDERRLRVVRGPSNARGGIITAAVIWGVLAVIIIPNWLSTATAGDPKNVMIVGMLLFSALVLAAGFAVPGIILGRADESLRKAAEQPAYRALLEQLRQRWHPQFGDQSFGPL